MKGAILALIFFLLAPSISYAQDSLRILTWNVQMLPMLVNNNGKGKRAKAIVDQLRLNKYDVIVFQEIFKKRSRRIIRKGLESVYPYQTKVLNKKLISFKTNGGVMILSRYPIGDVHEIRFKRRTGFDKLSRKGALMAELRVGGKTIQVVGTHLQAFGGDEILYSQYHQMRDELLKPNEKPGVPQFICGDLNTRKTAIPSASTSSDGGPAQTRYQYMLQVLDAEDGELTGDQQFTMDRPYNDLSRGNRTSRILLDYVLVRNGGNTRLTVFRQVKIFRQQWDEDHQDLSDHFALEAIITGY